MSLLQALFHKKPKSAAFAEDAAPVRGPGFSHAVFLSPNPQDISPEWVQAVRAMQPACRSIQQLEEYLVEELHAVPCRLSSSELETMKLHTIIRFFPQLVDKPPLPGPNPSSREIDEYIDRNHQAYERARAMTLQEAGLEIVAYRLPDRSGSPDGPIVQLERRSQSFQLLHGSKELFDQLVLYLGVSEQDLQGRTPRLLDYLHALGPQPIPAQS